MKVIKENWYDLPSGPAVMHMTEACDVTVVARITTLVFTIDVCDSFGHAYEELVNGV